MRTQTLLLGLIALGLTATAVSGCLVSFEGYRARAEGGASGAAARAGAASGGNGLGGTGKAGMASQGGSDGGRDGTAGSGDAGEASGGSSVEGGTAGVGGSVGGGTAGSAGAGGNGPITCPVNLEGPPMIEIPKPQGGVFCMDRTEVPNEDYAVFLASSPSSAGQAASCSWNTSFLPDTSASCATELGRYDPIARPRSPVSCVDWCDAKRYCEWAGKRLCGAIAGGPNPPSSFTSPNESQWFRACTHAGDTKFPYGDTYQASYCVGLDNSGIHPDSVANAPACEGGYDGLFDMSGNVAEWEDSCSANAGASDACLIRGGSMLDAESVPPTLLCNSSAGNDATPSPATSARNARDELIGLRCCLDL